MENLNYEVVTVGDCIDNFEKRGKSAVINDGKVVGFEDRGNTNG